MSKLGEKLRKLLMLLATWGLLLAFFIGYERYFVAGQREFLKEDGFRALTTLSGELNAQVQKAQKSTEALINLAAPHDRQEPPLQKTLENFVRLYIREAPILPKDWDNIKKCAHTRPENTGSSAIEIEPVRNSLTLAISCHNDKSDHALYTVDLVKEVSNGFEKQSSDFDDVLVADSSGNVIFQRSADPSLLKSSTKPQITNLKSLLTGSATVEPKIQDQESTKKNDSEKTTKGEPGSDETPAKKGKSANNPGNAHEQDSGSDRNEEIRGLIGASAFTEVTAAGKTYEMFSRPMRIALPFGKPWNLVVVGLWDAKQFDERSREIPYSNLIWAALIVVALLSLSWPLFKLRYMSNTERFTAIDGWYLVLALFLAATSVTLMLLNASYTSYEQDKSDQSMEQLASLMKSDLKDEMDQAASQLDRLSVPTAFLQGDFLTQQDFLKGYSDFPYSSHEFPYPYFVSAFWADGEGWQRHKVDVRSAPTPILNIGFRPYFKRASSAKEHRAEDHYLEPILSINTDEFEVDLAGLFQHGGVIKVETLSLRPMSLVDPVLPPGYGFAVIDADCNVLFHSDSYRNMREDFCEDSKDKDELKPWLFSGVDTPLDISYEGNSERAYLTSLESSRFALEASNAGSNTTQAFLLVFRKPGLALTLNLAVILVCSILMGAYLVVLVALALLYLLMRGIKLWVYPPAFLWPQRKHAVAYLQIFVSNIALLLLFWWSYPRLYEAPLLALTLVVAVVSILLSAIKLRWPDWGPVVLGALLAAIAFVSWLLIPSRDPRDPLDWEFVLLLLGASCLLAIFLANKVASTSHRKAPAWALRASEFAGRHFSKAYVLALLSLITTMGVVPCIGFFKYSYDAISELALKRDEIEVSERLINRQDRIKEYYSRTTLPDGAEGPLTERRMGEHWDRYDSHTFEVKKDSESNPCDTGEKHDQTLRRDDVNEVIEKWIAKATLTLTLPTNALGSQMSKLGVASTKDVEGNWEHCWTEPAPTSFQLFWKSTSRWPHETVTATYPDWKGLRPWPQRFFLILLWVGLGFWIAIILKKVFLTDLEDVLCFETVHWTSVAAIQQNLLVIEQVESGRELWKEMTNRLDLRVELKKMVEDKSYWPSWNRTVNTLILDHFDFNMKDENYNQARLKLLEALLCELGLKLVIITTVDPLYFLTDDAAEVVSDGKDSALTRRLLGRWASALSTFKKVYIKDPSQDKFKRILQPFKDCKESSDFGRWVELECDHTAKLREIGEKVLNDFSKEKSLSSEWVVSRVLDLADSYYHSLWAGLSTTERLVLFQLARDGWANPKNPSAIRQLASKQLVRRNPMYQIINESFRRFVLSPEHAEDIAHWEKLEQQSTWHALKFVAIAIGIGFVAWLLYAQAALSQQVVAFIAAITTLLTAAGGLFGRPGRATSAKAGGEQSSTGAT